MDSEQYFNIDITDEGIVQNFFDNLLHKYGKVESISLINCAGISVFDDYSVRNKYDFMRVLEVNLYGSFNMIQKS